MSSFVSALESGRVLLMDGAMGTQLLGNRNPGKECLEAWNLTQPDKVQALHRSYAEAGAEVLVANTFQANAPALARHQQQGNLAAIIKAGLLHARSALSGAGWVLADIGPSQATDIDDVSAIVDACRDADGLLLETFSDPAQAVTFVQAGQRQLGLQMPILVSFTFDGTTLRTFKDLTPAQCARAAAELGAKALGVNCGRELTMAACAEILAVYCAACRLPLFARPNAGTPAVDGYPHSPANMAAQLPGLLQAGAVMIGGCCGTTPKHIQAFRQVIDSWNAGKK
jgi:5-methyltetrahydrofolate--homocysteine methyltransferase